MSSPSSVEVNISPLIKVDGADLDASWDDNLLSVRVEQQVSAVGRATIRFRDADYALSTAFAGKSTFKPGAQVKITTMTKDLLFAGYVTGARLEQDSGVGAPSLIIVAHDRAYRLACNSSHRTFENMTYVNAVKKVLGPHFTTVNVLDSGTSSTIEYMAQSGSDLAFVDGLLARAGLVWWVDNDKFNIGVPGKSLNNVELHIGKEVSQFSIDISALRAKEAAVAGWDSSKAKKIAGKATTPVTLAKSDFADTFTGAEPSAAKIRTAALTPIDETDAKALAQRMLDESLADSTSVRITGVVNGALKPNVVAEIKNAGPASGKYHLTAVEHYFGPRGFETTAVAGSLRPVAVGETAAPVPTHAPFNVPGLLIGTVTNIEDDKKYGRVKVEFPTLGDENDASVGSTWARVAAIGGGKQRGIFWTPVVGDEVIVGFEQGDIRRPVVLGGLYSGATTFGAEGVKNKKVVSRRITSETGSHVLEFNDGDDTQFVLIKHKNGDLVKMSDKQTDVTIGSGRPLNIKVGNAEMHFTDSGDITIKAVNIKIEAQNKLEMKSVEVAAEGRMKVQVKGAMVDIQANAEAKINGGGMTEIKGGMVQIN